MNRWLIAFLVLAAALLQAHFFSGLSGGNIIPNLVLVTLVMLTLQRSLSLALVMAVWGGLWLDVAGPLTFGVQISIYLLLVLLIWALKRFGLEFDRRGSYSAAVLAGAYLYNLFWLLILWISAGALKASWKVVVNWTWEALIAATLAWLFGRRLLLAFKVAG